ncbi:MAG: hypothetical protein ACK5PW_01350 [Burkholderiales bacterium]
MTAPAPTSLRSPTIASPISTALGWPLGSTERIRCLIRRQQTIVGRLQRDIQSRVTTPTQAIRETLAKRNRVFEQTATRKTETPNLYRHARLLE